MKEEGSESQYSLWEYVDLLTNSNIWAPRLIISEDVSSNDDRIIKLKDPRHYLLATDVYNHAFRISTAGPIGCNPSALALLSKQSRPHNT